MGKIATKILARGEGWSAGDAVCTLGPRDRPFEERHGAVAISVVLEGSFQYRSARGSEVMSPGSVMLGNYGQFFECGHEHGSGDRCASFHYTPEFLDRARAPKAFTVHRVPPLGELAPWVAEAQLAIEAPGEVSFEELAHGIAGAVMGALGACKRDGRAPTAADERRISAALRFIEGNLAERMPLGRLSSVAGMSEFHFLRVFRQVMRVTPHQYILRARLREAALRLKARADAVSEIALDTGFGDLSTFHHAFRAEFGATPRAYRTQTRGKS